MLLFRKLSIEDKEEMQRILKFSQYEGSMYNFTTLYLWADSLHLEVAFDKDFFFLRLCYQGRCCYYFPAGKGDYKEAINLIIEDAKQKGSDLCFTGVEVEQEEILRKVCPLPFKAAKKRDFFDYVYSTQELIELAGSKYEKKRKLVNAFKRKYAYTYEKINETNIKDCLDLNERWAENKGAEKMPILEDEINTARLALEKFNPLGLKGGLLRVEGLPVGYALGEAMNDKIFIIHIMKADHEYQGSNSMIFKEFLSQEALAHPYTNTTDDAGDPNLRIAKERYHPVYMVEKSVLLF